MDKNSIFSKKAKNLGAQGLSPATRYFRPTHPGPKNRPLERIFFSSLEVKSIWLKVDNLLILLCVTLVLKNHNLDICSISWFLLQVMRNAAMTHLGMFINSHVHFVAILLYISFYLGSWGREEIEYVFFYQFYSNIFMQVHKILSPTVIKP